MNAADYTILGLLGFSLLLGMKRGFVHEASSLATWVSAFVIARMFSPQLGLVLSPYLVDFPSLRQPAAFVALFAGTLVVGGFIRHLLAELVAVSGMNSTDRALGMLFGGVRGALVIVLALGALAKTTEMARDPWWLQSRLIPEMLGFEGWADDTLSWASRQISKLSS